MFTTVADAGSAERLALPNGDFDAGRADGLMVVEVNLAGDWIAALQSTVLSHMMRGPVAYPLVLTVHVLGIAVLVGAVILFDLRLLGCSRSLAVIHLNRLFRPAALTGATMAVLAGALLFLAHPDQYAGSPLFLTKLALIVCAGLNAALFHRGVFRSANAWNVNTAAPVAARAHAVLSLSLWVGVICCGRLLAFI